MHKFFINSKPSTKIKGLSRALMNHSANQQQNDFGKDYELAIIHY